MPQLHRLDNGLTLCMQRIEGVASVAVHAMLPAGCAYDNDATDGIAPMHAELLLRGAGPHNSRALSDAMDTAGMHRGVSAGTQHLHLHCTTSGAYLGQAMRLVTQIMTAPVLPKAEIDAARSLCMLSLASLHDDPQDICTTTLHEMHRPRPLHRNGLGCADVLQTLDSARIQQAWNDRVGPKTSILAVAGHFDPDVLCESVESLLGNWTGANAMQEAFEAPPRGRVCIDQDTAQMQLALAFDAPLATDVNVDAARLAAHVLGGGSSSRLFLEVRQRRSLCYGIGARWSGSDHDGFIQVVTGTTPERVEETLETTLSTIQEAASGLREDEIARAVLQFRSHLVRGGESTQARASALARDVAVLGRVRGLPERIAEIESVAPSEVNAIAATWADLEPTIVAVGPEASRPW